MHLLGVGAAAADAPAYGSTQERPRTFAWEAYGAPWRLVCQTAVLVGRQYAALALIAFQVFFLTRGQSNYLMSCNPESIGQGASVVCEYSKGYVRCYPLLAMVVSIVVATRLVLHQRVYYVMLRRGLLVDFENFSPFEDPLFRIMLWCIGHAVCHFIFDILHHHGLTLDMARDLRTLSGSSVRQQGEQVMVFYLMPTFVSLYFLYASYDLEAMLLPLSKYWEEDPSWARQSMTNIVFVQEEDVAEVVMEGLDFDGAAASQDAAIGMDEACAQIARRAAKAEGAMPEGSTVAPSGRAHSAGKVWVLSSWRLVRRMWAAELLLDPRLADTGSRQFRQVWLLWGLVSLALMVFVLIFIASQVRKDISDVYAGQYTDAGSLAVEVAHLCVIMWISWTFVDNLIPQRHAKSASFFAAHK